MKTITQILTLAMLMMFASPMLADQNESAADQPMAQQVEKMQSMREGTMMMRQSVQADRQ